MDSGRIGGLHSVVYDLHVAVKAAVGAVGLHVAGCHSVHSCSTATDPGVAWRLDDADVEAFLGVGGDPSLVVLRLGLVEPGLDVAARVV